MSTAGRGGDCHLAENEKRGNPYVVKEDLSEIQQIRINLKTMAIKQVCRSIDRAVEGSVQVLHTDLQNAAELIITEFQKHREFEIN